MSLRPPEGIYTEYSPIERERVQYLQSLQFEVAEQLSTSSQGVHLLQIETLAEGIQYCVVFDTTAASAARVIPLNSLDEYTTLLPAFTNRVIQLGSGSTLPGGATEDVHLMLDPDKSAIGTTVIAFSFAHAKGTEVVSISFLTQGARDAAFTTALRLLAENNRQSPLTISKVIEVLLQGGGSHNLID